MFPVLPRSEDGQGGLDDAAVGGLLDEVADGREHLVGVGDVMTVVEQRLEENYGRGTVA